MAKLTLALAAAQIAAKDAELAAKDARIAALQSDLDHLAHRIKHDYVEIAEYRRVQANPGATAAKRPFSERCKAYLAATGARSVTMPQLQAWEASHA